MLIFQINVDNFAKVMPKLMHLFNKTEFPKKEVYRKLKRRDSFCITAY